MPLTQIYLASLRPLGRFKFHLTMIVLANLLLAGGAVLEPILFGHIIDSISRRGDELMPLLLWLCFAVVSTVAYVLTARCADRLAHKCRAEILTVSFENLVAMPVTWHNRRGSSNVFQTLVRACESLFNIWLEFMRSHLATFAALVLLIPTALATNLLLGLVLIALGLAYWWIGKIVMARTKDGQRAVEGHYHNVFMHMSDTINNVTVLHAFTDQLASSVVAVRTDVWLSGDDPAEGKLMKTGADRACLHPDDRKRKGQSKPTPVSSMQTFGGLLSAYWRSGNRWEAWGLTTAIMLLTALSSVASVWFAESSGQLVGAIASLQNPTHPTTPAIVLTTAATLIAIVVTKEIGFTALRHFFSATLHRKWRAWLDRRFNDALLDRNHTHFHLQHGAAEGMTAAPQAPDNIDQRVQESVKGMTGGAIGLAMGIAGVMLSLLFVGGCSGSSPMRQKWLN